MVAMPDSFRFCLLLALALGSLSLGVDDGRFVFAADDVAEASDAESEPLPNYDEPPLDFKPPLFFFTLVLFIGFIFVMKANVWQPLIAGLNAREARVVQAEREAQAARDDAQRLRKESETKLAEVHEQVKAILAEARSKAEAEKREILGQAEQEAERALETALAAIVAAREDALEELSRAVDEQVGLATAQVVGRRLG